MNWVDFLQNPQALRAVYGDNDLSDFSRVHLHELLLGERLDIRLRFSIAHMPTNLPRRWPPQANRVQFTLAVWSITSAMVEEWDTSTAGTLEVVRRSHGQTLHFTSATCHISTSFELLRLERMQGYMSE